MYRRVSINTSTETMLDSKRSTEIKSSLPQLSRQSVDVFNKIKAETENRLSVPVDVETKKRLLQRLTDIKSATEFFSEHKEIELIGIYGWGDSCQIKTDPGQGISQFDSNIYRKNGKVYVEKIGSCWQIFSSYQLTEPLKGERL